MIKGNSHEMCAALVPICFVLGAQVGGFVPENSPNGILESTQHNCDTLQQLLEWHTLRRPSNLWGRFCTILSRINYHKSSFMTIN